MNGQQIQALRQSLGETVHVFGERFAKSGRTIEGWECDRRKPDPLIVKLLEELATATKKRRK